MIKTTPAATGPMKKDEAKAITDRIRAAVDSLWSLLLEAHERKAWKALGYKTWDAYVQAEFDMSRRRSYQLLDQGRVIKALNDATGENVNHGAQISERDARDIKPSLPEVTTEIQQRVEGGEDPAKATDEAVKAAREKAKAEREQQKAEAKRQADEVKSQFSPEVKAQQQVKADAVAAAKPIPDGDDAADRIAELEENVRWLEAENARLKAENEKFAEMKVLFDKGGFEAVIKAKDETIRAQATRIESATHDMAAWKRSSDMWRKRAEETGWSNDITIDLETGEVVNG